MTPFSTPDTDLERRLARRLLDVLIRATILFALALLCYRVLAPFLPLAIWALIFAVTLYPLHLRVTAHLGGRPGIAATLLTLLGIAVFVVPIALLMSSLGDSIRTLIEAVQQDTLQIPAPPATVATWPVIGEKLYAMWNQAHDDLPALVQSQQPKVGELARTALGFVASIGGGLLAFLGALILAGIFMAFGERGASGCLSVFQRLAGEQRGASLARLSTATIRAVAQGVVGVALIQAILVGLALLVAGVTVGRRLRRDRSGAWHRPGSCADRDAAGDRLGLVARRQRHGRGAYIHRASARFRHGGQRAQAADAWPRRGRADARHPHRCSRWHGDRWHHRDVRRRNPAIPRLAGWHWLGRREPRCTQLAWRLISPRDSRSILKRTTRVANQSVARPEDSVDLHANSRHNLFGNSRHTISALA